jgi:hypothetical protein
MKCVFLFVFSSSLSEKSNFGRLKCELGFGSTKVGRRKERGCTHPKAKIEVEVTKVAIDLTVQSGKPRVVTESNVVRNTLQQTSQFIEEGDQNQLCDKRGATNNEY